MGAMKEPTVDLHEADFHAWTFDQADKLRRGDFSRLDVAKLSEELESLRRSEEHQLENRLAQLLMHLLKWQFQPAKRDSSWARTIREQRRRIERLLVKMPSLRLQLAELVNDAYSDALVLFECETGLNASELPEGCPYSAADVLQADWLPG